LINLILVKVFKGELSLIFELLNGLILEFKIVLLSTMILDVFVLYVIIGSKLKLLLDLFSGMLVEILLGILNGLYVRLVLMLNIDSLMVMSFKLLFKLIFNGLTVVNRTDLLLSGVLDELYIGKEFVELVI